MDSAPDVPRKTSQEILVTGSTGLVGSALVAALRARGGRVVRAVRPRSSLPKSTASDEPGSDAIDSIEWKPRAGVMDPGSVSGLDGVVHLAAASVASGRWSAARKKLIRDSRVEGTELLASTLAAAPNRPRILISASAVGIYGDRGDEWLDETSQPGEGFLADVAREWEAATSAASAAGVRVVLLRFGVILTSAGGLLDRMLPPFRMGLGGRLGSGRQFMSWITLDDAVRAILHALDDERLDGPVNATSPAPVRNLAFTRTLGRVLRRPTLAAVPAPILRLAAGELADELMLASARVRPRRLIDTGFEFQDPELEAALAEIV